MKLKSFVNNVILVPDKHDPAYDTYLIIPEGKSPEGAVVLVDTTLDSLDPNSVDYSFELATLLDLGGFEFAHFHQTKGW
jgi:hypothetical protein